ncbi:MAG: hypothetical protein IPP30_06690 [Flavobacterium sp.]|nr:hypothetical protein [Flavobacterium sp.]
MYKLKIYALLNIDSGKTTTAIAGPLNVNIKINVVDTNLGMQLIQRQ